MLTLWRNGSASDSRSEGCVFKSRQGQLFCSSLVKEVSSYCYQNVMTAGQVNVQLLT